jgi:hypothetical protein
MIGVFLENQFLPGLLAALTPTLSPGERGLSLIGLLRCT